MMLSIRTNMHHDKTFLLALASKYCHNVTNIVWPKFNYRCTYSLVRLPPFKFPELTELRTVYDQLLEPLSTETFFKKLYLNAFSTEQMERILNALREGNVQLERLRMRGFKCFEDFYGLVDELCEHKTVESVQINEINDDYLMRITQSLKHLNEFETSSTKVSMIGVRKALTEAIHMKKATATIHTKKKQQQKTPTKVIMHIIDGIGREQTIII